MQPALRKSPTLYVALALGLIGMMALFAFAGLFDAGPATAASGPRLWQEAEAPAYVYTPSMGEYWRAMRPPARDVVETWLFERNGIALDASEAEIETAVNAWYKDFFKRNYVGPDPVAHKQLLAREEAILNGDAAAAEEGLPTPQKNPLFVVVEFAGTDTITRPYPDPDNPGGPCVDTEFTWGPTFLGEIPTPGPRDNFTFIVENPSVPVYESVVYGEGPNAPGYGVVNHPNLGPVDLTGLTATNFLLEMSHGASRPGGGFLQEPVQVDHSHEYYGHERYRTNDDGVCEQWDDDARTRELPYHVVDQIVATYGDTIDWSQYDADGDHLIDAFVLIHAGDGNERGCVDCIWSHSSSLLPGFDEIPQIGGTTTPDDPSDDYFIRGYNQDPEPLDLGVIVEEYEHQWGLPDLYTVDGSNSNSWWGAPHTSGVWGGELGGTRPVGHNLWQDTMLGWRNPLVLNYDSAMAQLTIGRNRDKPAGTEDGLIIKLPAKDVNIPNRAGDDTGWYSTSGDLMDNRVYRSFDLSGASGQVVFSFDAYWDIEVDWDYGYLEVSTDGENWMSLPDMDGVLTDTDPNGNNFGWGLTGMGEENLRFDLSDYAGGMVYIRFRYVTDPAVSNPGWWVDNLLLADDSGALYENDLEADFSDWTVEGWIVVPIVQNIEQYYLVEWWDDNGMFNVSLNDPYYGVYSDDDEFEVDRMPFNTPGMTVAFRNTGEDFDYEIFSNLGDSPSYGPKFGLLVVDSHFEAMRFDTHFDNFQNGLVGYTVYGRTKSGNASFSMHDTNEKSARLGYDVDAGAYADVPLEAKTWAPEPGVYAFHDSLGYYPGFYYPGTGSTVYLHDSDSSVALPATCDYSTRITWPDTTPFPALYGVGIGPGPGLGTGNPGDDWCHYGIHLKIMEESPEQVTVKFWNAMNEVELAGMAAPAVAAIGDTVDFTFHFKNVGGADSFIGYAPLPTGTTYVDGSAFGGLVPVGNSVDAIIAAQSAGVDLSAMAADDGAVTGFLIARQVGTGWESDMGFSVTVNQGAVSPISTTLTFFNNGYTDDPFMAPWRSVSSSSVSVQHMVELPLMYDTWVNTGAPAVNYNSYGVLTSRTTGLDNILLAFDRSMLPDGATIDGAQLMVQNVTNQSGQRGKSMQVTNVSAFDPTTVTGADALSGALSLFNPGPAANVPDGPQDMTFDVTGQVATWNGAESLGFLAIQSSGPAGRVNMSAIESWPPGQQATLWVTYTD